MSNTSVPIPERTKISRPCTDVRQHTGFPDECSYVRANTECHSGTVIEYITAYYCTFSKSPVVAYVLFFVWLLMLFYMLGNTAADYFCCSLEKLSVLLRLPPTVAGVSLLPLGNGAPDVFASIASFLGTGHSQVPIPLHYISLSSSLTFRDSIVFTIRDQRSNIFSLKRGTC